MPLDITIPDLDWLFCKRLMFGSDTDTLEAHSGDSHFIIILGKTGKERYEKFSLHYNSSHIGNFEKVEVAQKIAEKRWKYDFLISKAREFYDRQADY